MPAIDYEPFRKFELKARLSWYTKNPVPIKTYTYTLTQYTPSVYATIYLVIPEGNFADFKQIDSLEVKDRIIELWFEPELYSNKVKQSFNSGPFRYCIVQYDYCNFPNDVIDTKLANNESSRYIKLMCVDDVFYKMTLDQKIESFGNVTATDVVKKLVERNGGKAKTMVQSNYSFRWLQPQLTDYQMIRGLIPYSQSTNGDLLYTFFMFNREAYYAPISYGKINTTKIALSDANIYVQYMTSDQKLLIEKYGSIDKMMIYDHGYTDFGMTKPVKMNAEAYKSDLLSFKQHKGAAAKYISMAIDDKKLQEIYISNMRQRIHTFSRIIDINVSPIPNITPITCVEILKGSKGYVSDLDGIFYVLSVTYTFGMTQEYPIQPMMSLTLSSELDARGMEKPEGKAIQ